MAWKLVGNKRFIQTLAEMIPAVVGLKKKTNTVWKSNTIWGVAWSGRSDLKLLYDWMYYPGHCYSMSRKREKLKAYLGSVGMLSTEEQNNA
jgi:hypothetical protein